MCTPCSTAYRLISNSVERAPDFWQELESEFLSELFPSCVPHVPLGKHVEARLHIFLAIVLPCIEQIVGQCRCFSAFITQFGNDLPGLFKFIYLCKSTCHARQSVLFALVIRKVFDDVLNVL